MPKLTIHTATYNRAYILPKAYESLRNQTCKDFEWIITDDGSTDHTEELVTGWMGQENGFDIRYNKLKHVGFPRAVNSGVNLAKADWFLMLDSDDYLVPEAVQKSIEWVEEIENDQSFAGIGFARCFPDGRYMKDQIPIINEKKGYVDASHIEREKYNLNMDMCEVHRTSIFREYPFRVWETEEYAPPQLNFNDFSLAGYKLRWRADKLYVCEYLPDGTTMNNTKVKRNPMGYAMMHNQNLLIYKGFSIRFMDAAYMIALCLYSSNAGYIKQTNAPMTTILAFPLGIALYFRRKRQFSKLP